MGGAHAAPRNIMSCALRPLSPSPSSSSTNADAA